MHLFVVMYPHIANIFLGGEADYWVSQKALHPLIVRPVWLLVYGASHKLLSVH